MVADIYCWVCSCVCVCVCVWVCVWVWESVERERGGEGDLWTWSGYYAIISLKGKWNWKRSKMWFVYVMIIVTTFYFRITYLQYLLLSKNFMQRVRLTYLLVSVFLVIFALVFAVLTIIGPENRKNTIEARIMPILLVLFFDKFKYQYNLVCYISANHKKLIKPKKYLYKWKCHKCSHPITFQTNLRMTSKIFLFLFEKNLNVFIFI